MGDLTKNLSRYEFKCKCAYPECTRTIVDFALPSVIQDAIDHFAHIEKQRSPVFSRVSCHVNSGHRCLKHDNDETDGKSSHIHTFGMGGDIWMEYVYSDGRDRKKVSDDDIADYFEIRYPDEYGIGRYNGRTHIDTRPDGPARWDNR